MTVKNIVSNVKKQLVSKYLTEERSKTQVKSTDINILLNRIEINKKNESRKKLYFSALASSGLLLFGLILFV